MTSVSGERAAAASAAESTLARPTSAGAVQGLPVQVGLVDVSSSTIVMRADARGGEGGHDGAAETARADHDHVRVGETALRVDAQARQHALAGVARGVGGDRRAMPRFSQAVRPSADRAGQAVT